MIDEALIYIKKALSENFSNTFEDAHDKIVLSSAINPDGSTQSHTEGKIVFFLVNVEEETSLKNNFNRTADKNGKFAGGRPTIHLNLNVLFCANFTGKSYTDGLAYLSEVIRFFQRNPVVTPGIRGHALEDSRLLFEMVKLDYGELSHLWSAIGSKLLPSVFYKVRLLAFKDNTQRQKVSTIVQPSRSNDV